MPKATITRALLRDLPAPPDGTAKVRIFDDRLPGFIAERRQQGTTFYLRYTDQRGRTREMKLGRLGDVSPDQARRQAEHVRSAVSLGADPLAERERMRSVPTVEAFVQDRYLPHCHDRMRPPSVANYEAYLRLRILPALGKKALVEVTQQDVAALRKQLIATGLSPSTVNRHLAVTRALFNLALKWELYQGRNPATSPGMLRERQRDLYLTADQTQALVKALDTDRCPDSANALALLVVTGARKNEILHATWNHVDLARGMLTVPRSKNGKPRYIPLSTIASALLARQRARAVEDNPHVFPSRRRAGKPLEDVRGAWERVKQVAGLAAELRIHDLRHSFASALANAGTPLFEIGIVLGHTQASTTIRYAHHAPQRLIETAEKAADSWRLPAITISNSESG